MKAVTLIKKVYSSLTILCILIVLATSTAVGWEYAKPTSDYFTHFGNVSVAEAFQYPDEIRVYSFGNTPPNSMLSAINKLYCVSADSLSREWVLIGTQYSQVDRDIILNALPTDTIATPISKHNPDSDLGVSNRHQFAELKKQGYQLYYWSLGVMRPSVSSSCYISTELSTETEIFKLPKTIEFKSIEFSYLVETE